MEIETIDAKSRYTKGIIGYILCFYLGSILISSFVMAKLLAAYAITNEMITIVVGFESIFEAVELYPDAVKCYLHISSLTNILTYILLGLMVAIVLKEDLINDAKEIIKEIKTNHIKHVLKKAFMFFGIFYLLNICLNFLLIGIETISGFSDSSKNQEFLELAIQYHPFLIAAATIVLAPLIEELIFRKCCFGLFKNKNRGLIVSSLIFGVIHIISSFGFGYNILEICIITLPYIASGLILGYIYMKSNYNIYYPVFVHMLSNGIAVSILLFL